jgi:RND family efflux transporter MFP subunit
MLAAALLLPACRGSREEAQKAPEPPAVEAVAAGEGTVPLTERITGIVRARNQVEIRPEISAPIESVHVRSGDSVRKGQVLVRLEDGPIREQLRQAEAAVKLAEAEAREAKARLDEAAAQVERTRALAAEKLVSTMELETLESQFAAARASADRAQAAIEEARATAEERRSLLERTVLRAPVSGRVGQRQAEIGMLARPDTLLFLLGNLEDLLVEIPLTQEILRAVREGTPVQISGPTLPGDPIPARVSRVSPFLEPGSLSTIAEIDLDNPGRRLSPGMYVIADLEYARSETATLLPVSALWEDPETQAVGVFVATGLRGQPPGATNGADGPGAVPAQATPVSHRPVQIVARGREVVGVRGVQKGEWVVVVGQHLLARDGSRTARVRPARWERVLDLQRRQREDLLEAYLTKQREIAAGGGLEPPPSEEFLGEGSGSESAPR